MDLDQALSSFQIDREMHAVSRERLLANATHTIVPPGGDILAPGDEVNGVYLVAAGAIRVYYIDPEGREGTLYWITPGESCILALNSLFNELSYPAWAAADEDGAEVYSVSGPVFRELFATDPAIQKFLFEQLSERVFSLLQLLEHSMRLPQENRLVLLLLAQSDEAGIVHLSHERLARHLGTIREVVSRLLRNLSDQGLVALAPRRIQILDRGALQKMVAED